jgi:glutamyl-tRNA synthetase
MGRGELVEAFSLERINKKAAVFDTEKLLWMNGQYLARMPADEVLALVGPALVAEGLVSPGDVEARPPWLLALVDLLKVRARSTLEIAPQARALLGETVEYDQAAVAKQWRDPETASRLRAVREALAAVEPWTPETIEPVLRAVAERLGVGLGKVAQPLRVALTGSAASPGIDQVLWLMGREKALQRVDAAVSLIASSGAAQENR